MNRHQMTSPAAAVPSATGTSPGAERAGPGAAPPDGSGAHGRLGNREKSGGRFSLNASRPSWASSLM